MAPLSDFEPLKPAEEKLKAAVAEGAHCFIATKRPDADGKTEENTVRAEFLRFLALGGDEDAPVHEKGVYLAGAWIEGGLDFDGCDVPRSLLVFSCWFDTEPVFADASMKTLALSGSRVPGIEADRLKIEGGVFLRKFGETAFRAEGEVRLLGAKIGGNLECDGGSFDNPDGDALTLEDARISRSLLFRDIEAFNGGLNLNAAHVADLVDAEDAWPEKGKLILDGFTYDRISGYAPTSFAARRKWLERQMPMFLNEDFRPQPFEQLAKVLREMGHSEDAKEIAVLKEDYQRKAEWLRAKRLLAGKRQAAVGADTWQKSSAKQSRSPFIGSIRSGVDRSAFFSNSSPNTAIGRPVPLP